MTGAKLPQRTARISDETAAEIARLDIRCFSQSEIARRTGIHRGTIKRVLDRTKAARAVTQDTEHERARAIAVYLEIQHVAWKGMESAAEHGRTPALLLAEIRQAQQRIDTLLGLAPMGGEDAIGQFGTFKALIVAVIQQEAPELAPILAQRLLEMRNSNDHE